MITVNPTTEARFEGNERGLIYLVDLAFTSATIRFNSSAETFTIGPNTYIGLGNVVEWPRMQESENASPNKLTLKFKITNQALLASVIGDATEYRLKPVTISLQLMTPEFQPDGDPVIRWRGYMDKVSTEKTRGDSGFSGAIKLDCVKPGLDRVRNYEGLRLSYQQRKQLYPNDRGLEYLQSLVQTPQPWLTVEFQKQV